MLSYFQSSSRNCYDPRISAGFRVYPGDSPLVISNIMLKMPWSPIIWRNGVRLDRNFLRADYAGIDFEHPDVSLEAITKQFCDSWHIIGTTRNHQRQKDEKPPMDRFRLLLRFERPITALDEYRHNITMLVNELNSDDTCIDGARIFFPCREIVSVNCDLDPFGEPLFNEAVLPVPQPTAAELRQRAQWAANAKLRRESGITPSFAKRWLTQEIPVGQRDSTCLRLGCELFRAGWDEDDAVTRVLASPTFCGKSISTRDLRKFEQAVRNGYRLARGESK